MGPNALERHGRLRSARPGRHRRQSVGLFAKKTNGMVIKSCVLWMGRRWGGAHMPVFGHVWASHPSFNPPTQSTRSRTRSWWKALTSSRTASSAGVASSR